VRLNWIVPARRAVVQESVEYKAALIEWSEALLQHRSALVHWYFRASEAALFDHARSQLVGWIAAFDAPVPPPPPSAPDPTAHADEPDPAPTIVSAAPESTATVQRAAPMLARLWKGPLRVLLEEQQRAEEQAPGPQQQPPVADPASMPTQPAPAAPARGRARGHAAAHIDVHRAITALVSSDRHEIQNSDATLLPGDVVEFPLHKLLALAGKTAFAPLDFDAQGSFLLCNSVSGESDGARLHENRIAMRFQALVGVARGAFATIGHAYDPAAYGGRGDGAAAPAATLEGITIGARGIMYGGPLSTSHMYDTTQWTFVDMNWGDRNSGSRNGLAALRGADLLTSAWSCSPCMLYFTFFILNLFQRGSPSGGVAPMVGLAASGNQGPTASALGSSTETIFCSYTYAEPQRASTHGQAETLLAEAQRMLAASMGAPLVANPDHADDPSAPAYTTPSDHQLAAFAAERLGAEPSRPDDKGNYPAVSWIVNPALLQPIAILSLTHHERSLVMLQPHDALAPADDPGDLPVVGFLAAYNPLTGAPILASGCAPQLFDFQAAGDMAVIDGYTIFECDPFRFVPLAQIPVPRPHGQQPPPDPPWTIPSLVLSRAANSAITVVGRGDSTGLNALTRVRPDALAQAHRGSPSYKPIAILGNHSSVVGTPADLHAQRSVPYPTLAEAAGAFFAITAAEAARQPKARILAGELAEARPPVEDARHALMALGGTDPLLPVPQGHPRQLSPADRSPEARAARHAYDLVKKRLDKYDDAVRLIGPPDPPASPAFGARPT
jgi:hypothetical protein